MYPVSYTHLDVYKRQRIFSSPDALTLTAKPGDTYNLYDALGVVNDIIYSGTAGNSPVTGIRVPSVSYTHLDVYKRQVPGHRSASAIPVSF